MKNSKNKDVFEPPYSNPHELQTIDDKRSVAGSNPAGPISIVSGGSLIVCGLKKDASSIWDLSKHELMDAIGTLSKVRKKKYVRRKEAKYGSINKGFTDEELKKFLDSCKNPKAKLAFSLMAMLGLRISEVINIKLDDLDFEREKIRISTLKANTGDFLHLHSRVRILLWEWISKHEESIRNHDNFILFGDSTASRSSNISSNWLRNEFRRVAVLANLNEYYSVSDESRYKLRKERKLHRLSTHSLRHYFITKIYGRSKDLVQAQKLARHRSLKSTQCYIHVSQDKLNETMKATFEDQDDSMEDYLEYMKFKKMIGKL